MNTASAKPHPAGLAETNPPGEGRWTRTRWLLLVALIFAGHVLLLFIFGGRKQVVPRPVTKVPALELADDAGEWLALNNPTLFALPHPNDFASTLWQQTPALKQPSFRWTEPPRWLPLSADALGTAFNQFMQTNHFAGFELQLKPPVKLSVPGMPAEPAPAQNSTLRLEGELAQRPLASAINLTNWPLADVLAPSVVQVLADAAGNVVSTVLLAPSGYEAADRRALELARAARFTPSPRLTLGRMIFNWHTVPVTATNEHE